METGSMLGVPRRLCRLGKVRRRAFARKRKNLEGTRERGHEEKE
jgi:hypothetical protein